MSVAQHGSTSDPGRCLARARREPAVRQWLAARRKLHAASDDKYQDGGWRRSPEGRHYGARAVSAGEPELLCLSAGQTET
jgi:hypothetical protein